MPFGSTTILACVEQQCIANKDKQCSGCAGFLFLSTPPPPAAAQAPRYPYQPLPASANPYSLALPLHQSHCNRTATLHLRHSIHTSRSSITITEADRVTLTYTHRNWRHFLASCSSPRTFSIRRPNLSPNLARAARQAATCYCNQQRKAARSRRPSSPSSL